MGVTNVGFLSAIITRAGVKVAATEVLTERVAVVIID